MAKLDGDEMRTRRCKTYKCCSVEDLMAKLDRERNKRGRISSPSSLHRTVWLYIIKSTDKYVGYLHESELQ